MNIEQSRKMGAIVISFDPATQNIGFRVEGLTPIETTGILAWCQHLFLASSGVGQQREQQMVIPASRVPMT